MQNVASTPGAQAAPVISTNNVSDSWTQANFDAMLLENVQFQRLQQDVSTTSKELSELF